MAVIYSLKCKDCMNDLDISMHLDADNDLIVEAAPCEECMEKARQEGRDEVTGEEQ